MAVIMMRDVVGYANFFKDNLIKRGSHGVYFYAAYGGTGVNTSFDHVFEGNRFEDQYYQMFYAAYAGNIKFRGNDMEMNSNYTGTTYGLYFYSCNGGLEIKDNEILMDANSSSYPIYLYYCNGVPNQPGLQPLVEGNHLDFTGSSTAYLNLAYYSD